MYISNLVLYDEDGQPGPFEEDILAAPPSPDQVPRVTTPVPMLLQNITFALSKSKIIYSTNLKGEANNGDAMGQPNVGNIYRGAAADVDKEIYDTITSFLPKDDLGLSRVYKEYAAYHGQFSGQSSTVMATNFARIAYQLEKQVKVPGYQRPGHDIEVDRNEVRELWALQQASCAVPHSEKRGKSKSKKKDPNIAAPPQQQLQVKSYDIPGQQQPRSYTSPYQRQQPRFHQDFQKHENQEDRKPERLPCSQISRMQRQNPALFHGQEKQPGYQNTTSRHKSMGASEFGDYQVRHAGQPYVQVNMQDYHNRDGMEFGSQTHAPQKQACQPYTQGNMRGYKNGGEIFNQHTPSHAYQRRQDHMQTSMQNCKRGEELKFGQRDYVQISVRKDNREGMVASHQNLHAPRPYVPAPMPKYDSAENVQVEYHPAAAFYNQQLSWEFVDYTSSDFQNPQSHYFYDRDCLSMAVAAFQNTYGVHPFTEQDLKCFVDANGEDGVWDDED